MCAEAYQLAGAVGAPEAALDNLSDAAHGVPLRHETFLPVLNTDCSVIAELARQRDEALAETVTVWEKVVCWANQTIKYSKDLVELTARAEAAEKERDEEAELRAKLSAALEESVAEILKLRAKGVA